MFFEGVGEGERGVVPVVSPLPVLQRSEDTLGLGLGVWVEEGVVDGVLPPSGGGEALGNAGVVVYFQKRVGEMEGEAEGRAGVEVGLGEELRVAKKPVGVGVKECRGGVGVTVSLPGAEAVGKATVGEGEGEGVRKREVVPSYPGLLEWEELGEPEDV